MLAVDEFLENVSQQAGSLEALQKSIVAEVNELVMGDGCSLFIRSDYVPWDPLEDPNRFVLVATSGLVGGQPTREEIIEKCYYEAGEGLTGWVAKYGATLRIHSRRNGYLKRKRQELIDSGILKPKGGESEVSPLKWKDKVKENNPDDVLGSPYLAVPIKLGPEIIAVVRLSEISEEARSKGKTRFSQFDERVLELCSHYILSGIVLGYSTMQTEIAESVARRLGHALKSSVGLIEANLMVLENEVGAGYESYFSRAGKTVDFLKRAGEISGRYWKAAEIKLEDRVEITSILDGLIKLLRDGRIVWKKPEQKYYIWGNKEALENVFLEIINNSRDFVEDNTGKIEITVKEKGGKCVVNVKDNGPGIHPSIRKQLFVSFAAYPNERLGMAMTLARRAIEKHGGTIAELNQRHGANFCVTLPLMPKAGHDTAERKES
jgi:hypothetical protein